MDDVNYFNYHAMKNNMYSGIDDADGGNYSDDEDWIMKAAETVKFGEETDNNGSDKWFDGGMGEFDPSLIQSSADCNKKVTPSTAWKSPIKKETRKTKPVVSPGQIDPDEGPSAVKKSKNNNELLHEIEMWKLPLMLSTSGTFEQIDLSTCVVQVGVNVFENMNLDIDDEDAQSILDDLDLEFKGNVSDLLNKVIRRLLKNEIQKYHQLKRSQGNVEQDHKEIAEILENEENHKNTNELNVRKSKLNVSNTPRFQRTNAEISSGMSISQAKANRSGLATHNTRMHVTRAHIRTYLAPNKNHPQNECIICTALENETVNQLQAAKESGLSEGWRKINRHFQKKWFYVGPTGELYTSLSAAREADGINFDDEIGKLINAKHAKYLHSQKDTVKEAVNQRHQSYTKEAVNQRRELRDLKGELKMMIDHENEDDDTVTLERLEFMLTEANFDIEKLPDDFLEKYLRSLVHSYYQKLPKDEDEYNAMSKSFDFYPINDVKKRAKDLLTFYQNCTKQIQMLVAAHAGKPVTREFILKVCEVAGALYIPTTSTSKSLVVLGWTARIAKESHHLTESFSQLGKIHDKVTKNRTLVRTEKVLAIGLPSQSFVLLDACSKIHFDLCRDKNLFVGKHLLKSLQPLIMEAGRLFHATLAQAIEANVLAMSFMLPKTIEGNTALIKLPHISLWQRKKLNLFKDYESVGINGRYKIVADLLYNAKKEMTVESGESSESSDGDDGY